VAGYGSGCDEGDGGQRESNACFRQQHKHTGCEEQVPVNPGEYADATFVADADNLAA
jgi:hypothetical protein